MSSTGDKTTVFTDGACQGNPGPGGWAWAVPSGPHASGFSPDTTNQRMEVTAALEALRALSGRVEVVSDSTYVVNCFRDKWWQGWIARGWKNSQRKPVANRDLWEPFVELYRSRESEVSFLWVKGHSGNVMNDVVDRLAVEAAATQRARSGSTAPRELGPADQLTGAPRLPSGHKVLVIGQRPPQLGGYSNNPVADQVRAQLSEWMTAHAQQRDDLLIVTGLGLGAEQLGAQAARDAGTDYIAVLAFPNQDNVWSPALRARFGDALRMARESIVLSTEAPSDKHTAGSLLAARDEFVVSNVQEALVVWNGFDVAIESTIAMLKRRLGDDSVHIITAAGTN